VRGGIAAGEEGRGVGAKGGKISIFAKLEGRFAGELTFVATLTLGNDVTIY